MKHFLFATTALALMAGAAAADVTLSGYGRFGLAYYSGAAANDPKLGVAGAGHNAKTWMEQRLRLDITASTTSDAGVKFGGKFRIQYDDGMTGATANAAQFFMTYEKATIQVGNVTTALDQDSAGVFYASEMGITATSYGDSRSAFYTYNSKAYSNANQSGVYGKYEYAGFRIEASYIDPNQYGDNPTALPKSEKSLVGSYSAGPLVVAAGGTWDGKSIDGNNIWFAGAQYAFTSEIKAGLNYIDEGKTAVGYDLGKTITAYASYTTGPVSVLGYVAYYDSVADELAYKTDTVYGLGASYNLGGGTTLYTSVQRNYMEKTSGEFGVKFKF